MPPRKAKETQAPPPATVDQENPSGGSTAPEVQEAPADGVVKTPIEAEAGGGAAELNAEAPEAAPEAEAAPQPEAEPQGEDHITAFDRRLERLIRIVEEAEFESGTLVGDIRDFLVDNAKHRPKTWHQMSAGEQADFNRNAEAVAKKVLRKLVLILAEQDDVSVHATLKGYAVDGETFKLKVVAKGDAETAAELFRMDGHEVILIRADARQHFGQRREGEVLPDQPGLSFADGGARKDPAPQAEPDHPADDSDLAGEDEEETEIRIDLESGNHWVMKGGEPEEERPATSEELIAEWTRQSVEEPEPTVRIKVENGRIEALVGEDWGESRDATLDELRFAAPDMAFRVNLTTSMIESAGPGVDLDDDQSWGDVRTADSDELAAERERLSADFDQGGATA
jgi:hypothetical protein